MSNTINVGDKFKPNFQFPSRDGRMVFRGYILEVTEIYPDYPDKDSVCCLVKVVAGIGFYAEFGTLFLLKACTPFEEHCYKDNLEEPTSNITPKCDCGATKVYGENIGPEMHAHYCILKSQQFIALDKK